MEIYLLIAFIGLLLMSAVFSSSETAFFSLSNFEIAQLEEDHPESGKNFRLRRPHRQLGNRKGCRYFIF